MKNTMIVNLYGAPGSGKSTAAAYIFSKLKMAGIDAEYVTEYAKDKVWENNQEVFKSQFCISGKQAFKISRCYGKVDVIITDSPIRLGKIYADLNGRPQLGLACLEEANQYPSGHCIEILLHRVTPYSTNGRNQTEEEADKIEDAIEIMLSEEASKHHLTVLDFDADLDGYDQIYYWIKQQLHLIQNCEMN